VKYYDEISQERDKSMMLKCGYVSSQQFYCSGVGLTSIPAAATGANTASLMIDWCMAAMLCGTVMGATGKRCDRGR
jgi:hypothetical protein